MIRRILIALAFAIVPLAHQVLAHHNMTGGTRTSTSP